MATLEIREGVEGKRSPITLIRFMAEIVGNGGTVVIRKTAIPRLGYFVYCRDANGNLRGMLQDDPSAGED